MLLACCCAGHGRTWRGSGEQQISTQRRTATQGRAWRAFITRTVKRVNSGVPTTSFAAGVNVNAPALAEQGGGGGITW